MTDSKTSEVRTLARGLPNAACGTGFAVQIVFVKTGTPPLSRWLTFDCEPGWLLFWAAVATNFCLRSSAVDVFLDKDGLDALYWPDQNTKLLDTGVKNGQTLWFDARCGLDGEFLFNRALQWAELLLSRAAAPSETRRVTLQTELEASNRAHMLRSASARCRSLQFPTSSLRVIRDLESLDFKEAPFVEENLDEMRQHVYGAKCLPWQKTLTVQGMLDGLILDYRRLFCKAVAVVPCMRCRVPFVFVRSTDVARPRVCGRRPCVSGELDDVLFVMPSDSNYSEALSPFEKAFIKARAES